VDCKEEESMSILDSDGESSSRLELELLLLSSLELDLLHGLDSAVFGLKSKPLEGLGGLPEYEELLDGLTACLSVESGAPRFVGFELELLDGLAASLSEVCRAALATSLSEVCRAAITVSLHSCDNVGSSVI
jgi:hypothetical protein